MLNIPSSGREFGNRASREAFEWLITLHDATAEKGAGAFDRLLSRFKQWLAADPANPPAFYELWKFWGALQEPLRDSRDEKP